MIRDTDIANALGQHLEEDPALGPIAWPNRDFIPARPYLVFDHVPVSRTDPTLDGSGLVVSGYLMISVVSDVDIFANVASEMADSIAAHFPYGLRLDVDGGEILISNHPTTQPPSRDGPDWRKPVKIHYRAS